MADTPRYQFTRNDPYDRKSTVEMVFPSQMASQAYMESIRTFPVPEQAITIWFFGQNGFILKSNSGTLIGIDLYLTASCATTFAHLPFRLNR